MFLLLLNLEIEVLPLPTKVKNPPPKHERASDKDDKAVSKSPAVNGKYLT